MNANRRNTEIIFTNPALQSSQHVQNAPVKEKSKLETLVIWVVFALYSSCNVEFNKNITGITFTNSEADFYLILLTTYLLCKGLIDKRLGLIFPWVSAVILTTYYYNYKNYINMVDILLSSNNATGLHWTFTYVVLIIIDANHPNLRIRAVNVSRNFSVATVRPLKTFPTLENIVRFLEKAFKLKHEQEYDLLIVDYEPPLMENSETDDETGWNCSVHPSVFFLLGTLVLTTCATGMLCAAIMTDNWEEVTWDKSSLDLLANSTIRLQWLLDHTVARVSTIDKDRTIAFLVPMHGGIWTLCVSLTEEEIGLLGRVGFPTVQSCVNYLSGGIDGIRGYEPRAGWQHRMQNLSISCALVCLIILGSAALIGAFGVFQHQISAVLVTGVMYLLAASFALFTLTIIHFKRLHSRPNMDGEGEGTVDGVISPTGGRLVKDLLPARIFTTSWSLDLGWGGVMLCVMTSVLWILLSKIMRFNPISSMIN